VSKSDIEFGVLANKRVIAYYPELAKAFDVLGALLVQQIHYGCLNSTNIRDGHRWVYITVSRFVEFLHTFAERTVRYKLKELVDAGVIITGNYNTKGYDKTRWYRLDYKALAANLAEVFNAPCTVLPHRSGNFCRVQVGETAEISSYDDKSDLQNLQDHAAAGAAPIPKINNKNTKTLSPAFGSATTAVEEVVLATPKKKRVAATRPDSVTEVLATQSRRATDLKAGRRAAAEAGEIDTKNLQALLDRVMADYLPDLPRVIVTAQPLSVFKKRIKAAEIKDLSGFLRYTIREWPTFAAQNRAARMKDPTKARRGDALPEAPNFTALAYRLPYFIAAYSNDLVLGKQKAVESVADAEVKKLKAQVAALQQESMAKTDMIRRISRKPVAAAPKIVRTPRVVKPEPNTMKALNSLARRTQVVELEEDWTPPEWGEGSRARKGA
jgi:hypothetical protein